MNSAHLYNQRRRAREISEMQLFQQAQMAQAAAKEEQFIQTFITVMSDDAVTTYASLGITGPTA